VARDLSVKNTDGLPSIFDVEINSRSRAYQVEAQYIQLWKRINLTVGAGTGHVNSDQTIDFTDLTVPATKHSVLDNPIEQSQFYAYARWVPSSHLTWILGANFESL
jgi:hypothetical protein